MSKARGDTRLPLLALPLAGLAAALAACGGSVVSDYTVLDGSLEPLRTRFEADAGKVRAIFLASPT